MKMRVVAPRHVIWLCLALLACAPIGPSDSENQDTAAMQINQPRKDAQILVLDSASIAGEWDVARFEGQEPKRLQGAVRAAFADFSERGVRLRIECNYSGRTGAVRNGRFIALPDSNNGQTEMGCGHERETRDSRFFSFFGKSPMIERDGPNRLRLYAEGTELILERPAIRRLHFAPTIAEIQGKWRMIDVVRYLPEGGFSGVGLSEVPGWITISGDHLSYSSCPQFSMTFRLAANGKLKHMGQVILPKSPRDCSALAQPAPAIELPERFDALRVLYAEPTIEKVDDDSLLLSTDGLGLLITKSR
jgi:hypothetical protein